jgi:Rod binding domain-containing protein
VIAGVALENLWADAPNSIAADVNSVPGAYFPAGASGSMAAVLAQAHSGATLTTGTAATAVNPRLQKLEKAAQQFESLLLSNLWKSMKTAFGEDDDDSGDPASGALEDWGMEAMSGAVGRAGGLGIGRLIVQHLAPKTAADPAFQNGKIGNLLPKGWANPADIPQ